LVKKISVLVIGHDDHTSHLIEMLKSQNGAYGVIEISDSLEHALGLLLKHSFDAIIVDSDLNKAPGLESVRRLIAAAPDTAIIVVSDHRSDDQLAIKSVRFGAQDYIERVHLAPLLVKKSIIYAVERKHRLLEKDDLFSDLASALRMIDKLQHLLPLCACCKKLYYEETQNWLDIDAYLEKTGKQRTPAICPDCRDSLAAGEH